MSEIRQALKPCPFCGGEVTMAYTGSSDWEVTCNGCPVETKFWVSAQKHGYGEGEHQEAIRRWNTRAKEQELADENLELRAIIVQRMADDLKRKPNG